MTTFRSFTSLLLLLCCAQSSNAQFGLLGISIAGNTQPVIYAGSNANTSFCIAGGRIWSWGDNSFGQLGLTGYTYATSPHLQSASGNWIAIASGSFHTIALNGQGEIWTWGDNQFGQCGVGTTGTRVEPAKLLTAPGIRWKTIACSDNQSFAIATDGSLWAWGLNNYGQSGTGSTLDYLPGPVRVGTDNDWEQVAAGSFHALAIKKNGTMWAWGAGHDGQLGNNGNRASAIPVQVGIAHDWQAVTAAGFRSYAIKKDGSLWAWGAGENGELGTGCNMPVNYPVRIGTDTWLQVSAGFYHTVAISSRGEIWTWGRNDNGQLGLGNLGGAINTPVKLPLPGKWIQVSAGAAHSMAVRSDGELRVWGQNEFGQLGTGDLKDKSAPAATDISEQE